MLLVTSCSNLYEGIAAASSEKTKHTFHFKVKMNLETSSQIQIYDGQTGKKIYSTSWTACEKLQYLVCEQKTISVIVSSLGASSMRPNSFHNPPLSPSSSTTFNVTLEPKHLRPFVCNPPLAHVSSIVHLRDSIDALMSCTIRIEVCELLLT